MKELVSAIITTHNRLDLLKKAVESVLQQTYINLELIIVDDNSSDGTEFWCQNLSESSKRKIKYVHIKESESRGGNYARNIGIKNAEGKYIAFLDDDDRWLPNKVTLQVDLIENRKCDLVYGGRFVEVVDSEGSPNYFKSKLNRTYQGDVSQKILTNIFTTTSLIMVRKQVFDKVGLFDENLKFWQEYELSIRIAQVSEFYYVDAPLIYYRVDHSDKQRLTNKYFGWKKAVCYIHDKHKNLYDKLSFNDKLASKALVWHDAYERCKSSRLKVRYSFYFSLWNLYKLYLVIYNKTLFDILSRKFFHIKGI